MSAFQNFSRYKWGLDIRERMVYPLSVVEIFFELDTILVAWRWIRWVAFHSESFANFMYIEFGGRVIGADLSAVPPTPHSIEFADEDVWLNMAVMLGMMVIYRVCAMLWGTTKSTVGRMI